MSVNGTPPPKKNPESAPDFSVCTTILTNNNNHNNLIYPRSKWIIRQVGKYFKIKQIKANSISIDKNNIIYCVNNRMLDSDWLLTAHIYSLILLL